MSWVDCRHQQLLFNLDQLLVYCVAHAASDAMFTQLSTQFKIAALNSLIIDSVGHWVHPCSMWPVTSHESCRSRSKFCYS